MSEALKRKVTFSIREVPEDRTGRYVVTCQICKGPPFAFCKDMTEVNLTKKTHRDKHAFAAGLGARNPEPLSGGAS